MLLAESLLLLALDPLSGRLLARCGRNPAVLRGAMLMELVVLRELQLEQGRLVMMGDFPDYHRLVEEVHRRLHALCPAEAGQLLRARSLAPAGLADELLQSMADRDILHRDGRRRWWLFGPRDYPIRSMQARKDARGILQQAVDPAHTDLRGLALMLLFDRSGLAESLLEPALRRAIHSRLAALQPAMAEAAGFAAADRGAVQALWAIGDALVSACDGR